MKSTHIAAFHLGALGDLVRVLPALHELRRRHRPRARLTLFASGAARAALARRGAAAHEAFDLGRADLAPLFGEGGAPPPWFPRFDAAYVLIPRADALIANLRAAGIPSSISVPSVAGYPRLRVPAADRTRADAGLRALGIEPGRGLLLHPGSGGARKCWPADRFVELARGARAVGLAPLFALGPVELETRPDIVAAIERSGLPAIVDVDLPRLAALAARAGSYVGNDSGPTHLAAAAGARTLALFGPSDPAVWAPRGRRVHVLRAPEGDLARLEVAAVVEALGGW